jgi:serine/threonine protein kinase
VGRIHKKDIIHRDLKPENILVGNNLQIRVADLGFAIRKSDPLLLNYQRVGTLDFYPYEMLNPTLNGHMFYDHRVDIWCMGVILYEMLYGTTPFYSVSGEVETKKKIRNLQYSFPNS